MADSERHQASPSADTTTTAYTERLVRKESAAWKRWLNVQAPYRWNLRRMQPGYMLDVGCGIGRNLLHVDGHGVGVDHNPESVAICRKRGLEAYTAQEFAETTARTFDTLLFAHVVEHMTFDQACELVATYLPLLRTDRGKVIFITPQERGYRSDPTHVEFVDFQRLDQLCQAVDLDVTKQQSFPFPRKPFGELFPYNEFVVVATPRRR